MLQSQLKGMPEAEQNRIVQAVEKNPKLFSDIANEVQEKMKTGLDQQTATMNVIMKYQKELQDVLK